MIAHLQSACEEDISWAVESAKQGQKYGLPCLRWRAPVFFDVPEWIFLRERNDELAHLENVRHR